jgi:ribosomal protein L40E
MRIAVLILGLLFNVVLFLQTVLIAGLGSAANDEATAGAGAVGVFVSLLWLVASALVLAFPMASAILFVVAGLFGFAVSGDFPDMAVWGGIALILAVMSFFGWRGKKKQARAQAEEYQQQRDRDDRLEQMLRQQVEGQRQQPVANSKDTAGVTCASCGARNPATTKFCGECGAPVQNLIKA